MSHEQQKIIIYVKVLNRLESIELTSNTSSEDLKETLRSAAEANQNDIIKLYKYNGNLVSISPSNLEPNSSKEPYRLEIIFKNIVNNQNNDVKNLVERIEYLETKLQSVSNTSDNNKVDTLYTKLNTLCQKLENLEHLSWLGFFKETRSNSLGNSIISEKNVKIKKNKEVFEQFKKSALITVSEETKEYLKTSVFDNWKYEDAEMLMLLQQMFIDLDLTIHFAIKIETLQEYLFEIYSNYNDVPFHNFRHAFVVTQMMYGLIWMLDLKRFFDPIDILCMIVSAVSHDLDHDGYNNNFQINAKTHLALIYNDRSPLEMYHCAVAFHILNKSKCNILANLDNNKYCKFRENMIQIILATDMAYHNTNLKSFESVVDEFDFQNVDHRLQLMKIVMKVSDISNEVRPVAVSEQWLECLLTEFFNQGDHEKLNGLPLTPLMDRENFSKAKSQIGFISFVLLPLIKSLSKLFPDLNNTLVKQVNDSLNYYQNMKDSVEPTDSFVNDNSG